MVGQSSVFSSQVFRWLAFIYNASILVHW